MISDDSSELKEEKDDDNSNISYFRRDDKNRKCVKYGTKQSRKVISNSERASSSLEPSNGRLEFGEKKQLSTQTRSSDTKISKLEKAFFFMKMGRVMITRNWISHTSEEPRVSTLEAWKQKTNAIELDKMKNNREREKQAEEQAKDQTPEEMVKEMNRNCICNPSSTHLTYSPGYWLSREPQTKTKESGQGDFEVGTSKL